MHIIIFISSSILVQMHLILFLSFYTSLSMHFLLFETSKLLLKLVSDQVTDRQRGGTLSHIAATKDEDLSNSAVRWFNKFEFVWYLSSCHVF